MLTNIRTKGKKKKFLQMEDFKKIYPKKVFLIKQETPLQEHLVSNKVHTQEEIPQVNKKASHNKLTSG